MCEYIKDDGEQCGFDNHDGDYCHVHEDMVEDEFHSAAFSGAQSDFMVGRMETTCDQCGTSLRRRERLSEHPHSPRRLAVEAIIKCDCAEEVIATTSIRKDDAPDGWY